MMSGSAANGKLAEGCVLCSKGAKMVLFVTGRCGAGCFFCPVSKEKRGKDVVYADEWPVKSDDDVIAEARAMNALGAGITGGDPSENVERTVHFIRLLKKTFGRDFHIHLYTSSIDSANAAAFENAGLDEIRFHPRESMWRRMDETQLAEVIEKTSMDVGVEVPALPGREDALIELARYAFGVGADFMNLNELEFSESNWGMMELHGYGIKNEESAAVKGSEETAMAVMNALPDMPIHYCSASFKDGVQLRNRMKRRALHTAKSYDVVTDDGTILKGVIYADDLNEAKAFMADVYEVPDELMSVETDKNRLEIAPWVLEEIGSEIPYECYIVEEYPTEDRLEVERIPMNRKTDGQKPVRK